jgi:lipopolysaccharide export system protein LptA
MKRSAAVASRMVQLNKNVVFGAAFLILLASLPSEAKPRPTVSKAVNKSGTQSGAQQDTASSSVISLGSSQKRDEPVYVTSDKLDIDTQKREFIYSGNVKVVQGDVTINAQEMIGNYGADDKIERIVAKKNVTIVKAPDMRATSQSAIYQAKTGIVTLTENPHLFQGGNDLAADKITIDLNTNKSSAEGQVRMKVIKESK